MNAGASPEAPDEGALFEQLCELPPDTQAARLDALARSAPALAARLRRLLALDAAYGAHTARSVVPALVADPLADVSDVGPFRLLRQIGRGGMGVVYLAERRDNFAQQVAIKLMPRFAADDAGHARFARERGLLAQLRHPHICSILDGGELADGTPWLAMEYLQGDSLCVWCETHRATLETRIDLFLQLCGAVQYAHRNLVIHRDIKDSNVLVDEHGAAKLLDFGIAKALDAGNAHTAAHDLFFSPTTAAPEQIRGERGTVAVDIYALGALLHRLLSGVLPFEHERGDRLDLQRAVLERVPPRVSDALQLECETGRAPPGLRAACVPARLRGELDAIVAHCLRKRPDERYADVADLARDLQAWRTGHPLSISDRDRLYRMRKFIGRHRNAALFAALALASVLIALAVTLRQAELLRVERDQARAARAQSDADRDRARAIAAFMRETFEQADPGRAKEDTLMARDLIERGKTRLHALDNQPQTQADLALMMAENEAGLGLLQESDATYRAHAARIEFLATQDAEVRWRAQALQLWLRRELDPDTPALDARMAALAALATTPERKVRVARERQRLHERRSEYAAAVRTLDEAWRTFGAQLSTDDALRLRIDLGDALLSTGRQDDASRVIATIDRDDLRRRDPEQQIRAWRLIARAQERRHAPPSERAHVVEAWRKTAERYLGPESLEAASAYIWTVSVIHDPAEQRALMTRAYAIKVAKLPPVSLARAYVERNMAAYDLEFRKAPQDAERHLALAVEFGRRATSRAHADVRNFEQLWAHTLNALGRHARCLEALSSPPGGVASDTDAAKLSALDLELATAALALGQRDEALRQVEASIAVWQHRSAPYPVAQAAQRARLLQAIARGSPTRHSRGDPRS